MKVDVTVSNRVADAIWEIRNAITEGLEEVGETAEGYAKAYVPVDTGRLRDSITHTVDEDTMTLSANTEYAAYVELGTIHQGAQPYLYPAVRDHGQEYTQIIGNAISKK